MKKKSIILSIALIFVTLIAGSAITYAAWQASLTSSKNTVTVGSPVRVSVGTSSMSASTIRPGDETGVSTTVTVDLTDAGGDAYKLTITGIEFKKEADDAWTTVSEQNVWKYKGGNVASYANLAENAVICNTAATGEVTLTLMVSSDLAETYAGYSLSFYVSLELVD